ncbi:hypothetical protein RAS1_08180 [Phycisphaerae bacterium RAS1]|nr:hypothetical protein RAS1_08180 [Phycisphaerae bacterium RAS1]
MSALSRTHSDGFTLIELSVSLVIIALIIGGILIGRDLIREAEIRRMIAQLEQFNTAVNTFRVKYGCLPGDCVADGFGFDSRANGNNDGKIFPQGTFYPSPAYCNPAPGNCENADFWYHLSAARFIGNAFQPYADSALNMQVWNANTPSHAGRLIPRAVMGARGGLIYGQYNSDYGWSVAGAIISNSGSAHYQEILSPAHNFVLSHFVHPSSDRGGYVPSDIEAIDRKIDDGLPFTGRAIAWSSLLEGNVNPATTLNSQATGAFNHYCHSADDPPRYNIIGGEPSDPVVAYYYRCGFFVKGAF